MCIQECIFNYSFLIDGEDDEFEEDDQSEDPNITEVKEECCSNV